LVNDPPYIILKEAKQACAGSPVALKAFVNASKTEHVDRDSLRYFWDFGDGMAQEGGPDMSHAYNNGGEYLVRVLADDRLGTECSNYTATMKVKINSPPVVKVGPNLVCCANVKSSFEASCSSGPGRDTLVYDWDFGDGATARGAKVTHVFKKAGKYKITLRVDDNFGTPCSSSTESFEVDVRAEPVAIMEIR
jgi:PKD repeat protein